MERKLAHIEKVLTATSIEGAVRIESVQILGWTTVVKKSEFSIGQKVIFCEVDCILPEGNLHFEFMRDKKFRIKTCRLRGALSQGLVFPLSILPEGNYEVGEDVSEILGIKKYEPPIDVRLCGDNKGNFPWYTPKTDEIRIQSVPGVLDELRGIRCYRTVKVDGTSFTVAHRDGVVDVCSRTWSKKEGDCVYSQIATKYGLVEKVQPIGNIAIQGEIAGPGIQKNRLALKDHQLFVFNVYDIDRSKYVDFENFVRISHMLGLQTVPIEDPDFVFDYTLEQLLEMAKGVYPGTKNQREGIVIRPREERYSQALKGRMSIKVINNEFLLKGGD